MSYDPTTAKEMLLMAPTVEEQQFWVARLLKRIQKSGYKAAGQVMIRVAPDIRPFLISGIRPDIRFRLPDIRLALMLTKAQYIFI